MFKGQSTLKTVIKTKPIIIAWLLKNIEQRDLAVFQGQGSNRVQTERLLKRAMHLRAARENDENQMTPRKYLFQIVETHQSLIFQLSREPAHLIPQL